MKTYGRTFDAHGSMLMERRQRAHAEIAAHLEEEGAVPLTVGAYQMMAGIHAAAASGVQILSARRSHDAQR